jgi:hypothetical protein
MSSAKRSNSVTGQPSNQLVPKAGGPDAVDSVDAGEMTCPFGSRMELARMRMDGARMLSLPCGIRLHRQ